MRLCKLSAQSQTAENDARSKQMKFSYWAFVALIVQCLLVLWLNFRLELDPFSQLVLVPLLLLCGLWLYSSRQPS
jgi:type VI protein secretion system component VasF